MSGSDPLLPWSVPELDADARQRAELRQASLTKPPGSLGVLERIVAQLAALQGRERPLVRPAAALIFAADHPVVQHGVSAYPAEVTAAMLANFAAGGAAASVLARMHGLPLRVIDVGVLRAGDPSAGVGDLLNADAMTREVYAEALRTGAAEVEALGPTLRLLVLGEMGIGNTTVAAAVYAGLLGGEASVYAGPGTGVTGEALERKRLVLRGAVERARRLYPALQGEPHRVLQALGGRDIAAIVGAMARAISGGVVVLVDGFIVGAAALVLCRLDPRWRSGMIFAHRSAEPAHTRALQAMDAMPLLDLEMRLGEASGALVAFPVVEAACLLHAEMATFAEAAVPGPEDMDV